MTRTLAISLAVLLMVAADASQKEGSKDVDALQGSWELIAGEADGRALSPKDLEEGWLVVKGDQYKVTLGNKGTVKGTQKIDASGKPKTIDITDATGTNKGQTCLGIYELKGDEFHVVFSRATHARPSKFTTEADSGQWMHVWKRVKEKE